MPGEGAGCVIIRHENEQVDLSALEEMRSQNKQVRLLKRVLQVARTQVVTIEKTRHWCRFAKPVGIPLVNTNHLLFQGADLLREVVAETGVQLSLLAGFPDVVTIRGIPQPHEKTFRHFPPSFILQFF